MRALPLLALPLLLLACLTTRSGPPLSARDQARVHLERDEPAQAIALLDELVREAPRDYELLRLRAEAYVRAGRGGELLSATQGSTPQDHYTRGLLRFARAGDTAAAVAELRAGAALAPDEPELHHRLGLALLESEQFEASLDPLLRAAQLAPDRRGYQLPLAKALHRNGRTEQAVEALRKVALGQPSPPEVKTGRQLMAQIRDPFANFPKAAEGKLEQGMKWLHVADVPQQAIIAFEEILQDYPDQAGVRALLGLAYQRIDDAGRAVEEFKRSIELDPSQGRPHLFLGVLYQSRQRGDQAREEYERAIQLDPYLDDAWARLGDMALERSDAPQAQRAFDVLSHLQPDNPGPLAKLALALQLQGDFAAAQLQLERALQLAPDNLELQLRMGLLFVDKKRSMARKEDRAQANAEAEKWLRKVLDAQPDNALASQALESLRTM